MSSRRDPFAVLGLDARAGLSDDEVRVAWRRIAAGAHPDRADGGSPERYAAAAAAYATLRTSDGRGEALADLADAVTRSRHGFSLARRRQGRWRFPVRVLAAVALGLLVYLAAGWSPGTLAVLVGAATWAVASLKTRP